LNGDSRIRFNNFVKITIGVAIIAMQLTIASAAFGGDNAVGSLAVVVHKKSTTDNLSSAALRGMFTGDIGTWPDSSPVIIIELPNESATAQRTLRMLLKTTPVDYYRQLMQAQFQGKQTPAIKVLNTDANAIRFVFNVPTAISIVDANAAFSSSSPVKVLRIDGKLPGERGYPLQ
jgi:ABC-type phosphate transport system substrate-binding protein